MTLLLLMGLFGCGGGSREEKAEKRILEAMQEKYGKEFVLDSIGGSWGTMNNNTLKAVVRPADDDTLKVPVEITKDLKDVYDMYLNQAVARNEQPKIEAIGKKYWPEGQWVVVNDTKLRYPEHNDTSMPYTEFIKLYPTNTQIVTTCLNIEDYMDSKGMIDTEAEVKKYIAYAKELAEQNYVSSQVSLLFLTPEALDKLEEAKRSEKSVLGFYMREQESGEISIATMVTLNINAEGKVVESEDKIKAMFDKDIWKQNRQQISGQKGAL